MTDAQNIVRNGLEKSDRGGGSVEVDESFAVHVDCQVELGQKICAKYVLSLCNFEPLVESSTG